VSDTRYLSDRMAAVMARISSIPKNGRMPLGGRQVEYVRNDDLMEALRPACAAEGLAISVSIIEVKKGLSDPVGLQVMVRLSGGGEVLDCQAYGEGRTSAIALTYALKYWILRTFLIGSGEEDEDANDGPRSKKRGTPAPAPAPTPAPAGDPHQKGLAAVFAVAREIWGNDSKTQLQNWLNHNEAGEYDSEQERYRLSTASVEQLRAIYRDLQTLKNHAARAGEQV